MQEENGFPRRLRELEGKVQSHIAASIERDKRIEDGFHRNDSDHANMVTAMEGIDRKMVVAAKDRRDLGRKLESTATRLGMMIAAAGVVVTFVYFVIGR